MSVIIYNNMKDFVIDEIQKGNSWKNLYPIVQRRFNYSGSRRNFSRYFRSYQSRLKTNIIEPPKKLSSKEKFEALLFKNDSLLIQDVCDKLNLYPRMVFKFISELKNDGKEIVYDDLRIYFNKNVKEEIEKPKTLEKKEIIFAVASDLHFGSKACQITRLHEFCDECKRNNVKYIFTPGDVFAGNKVYPGQEFELYAHGSYEQEMSLIKNLPTGFTWFALAGNHDHSFINSGGHNPLRVVANKIRNFNYVGLYDADIEILPGVDLKLWHPRGGVAYAMSYKLQKRVDQVAAKALSDILKNKEASTTRIILAGHYHVAFMAIIGGILGVHCGAFEGSTSFTDRLGYNPSVGGWIFKAELSSSGLLRRLEPTLWLREEIKDDWKNYDHAISEQKNFGPLF